MDEDKFRVILKALALWGRHFEANRGGKALVLVWVVTQVFRIGLDDVGVDFIRQRFCEGQGSPLRVFICDERVESKEAGGNEMDVSKRILSSNQAFYLGIRERASRYQENTLNIFSIRGRIVELEH